MAGIFTLKFGKGLEDSKQKYSSNISIQKRFRASRFPSMYYSITHIETSPLRAKSRQERPRIMISKPKNDYSAYSFPRKLYKPSSFKQKILSLKKTKLFSIYNNFLAKPKFLDNPI